MADETTATPPAAPVKPETPPEMPAAGTDWVSRAGTILMGAALVGLAVVLLDVALKGRLLGPLLARLPGARQEGENGGAAPGTPGD